MNTPSPRYFCPECRAGYTSDQNFCSRCGADMKHVSGLEHAARSSGSLAPLGERRTSRVIAVEEPASGDAATEELSDSWVAPVRERRAGKDPWLGRVVDARYKVIEVLGRGGMGVVYKVEHVRMGKLAAMKVLHGELADDPGVVGRFRREAEAVSRLSHPNTVQVFDFGAAGGALYLIMEYVRGLDLGSTLKRDGPMSFNRSASLFAQVLAALGEAHGLGIVHRDIKPENILVTRTVAGRDFVKVLDFGLAKLAEREEQADVTGRGNVVGTPYYMSPEQIRGEEVDHRSDLYSMGALMYRVLTGVPPYTAKSPVGVLTKHLTGELPPPSQRNPGMEIHEQVDALVMKAMSRDREQRYQTAEEMVADLEDVWTELGGGTPSQGLALVGLRPSARTRALIDDEVDYGVHSSLRLQRQDLDHFEASLRRRRWIGLLVVPLIIAALAGVLTWFYLYRREPPRTSEVERNDELAEATLISAGAPVTGYLGKRVSRTEPDRDYYRVELGDQPVSVTVHVTGLPNIDVDLALFDATGKLLVDCNEVGRDLDEWVRNYRVRGDLYVRVTQAMRPGATTPTENVSDPYYLDVQATPAAPGIEMEPNDLQADALVVRPGSPIAGYLERRGDIDVFRFEGPAGSYQVRIGGAASVPLTWRIGDGEAHTERDLRVDLAPGDIVRLHRSDASAPVAAPSQHPEPAPGTAEPYALEITPAR